ncbi:hypothetical protein ABKN59_000394 [Abortiporus biennis]
MSHASTQSTPLSVSLAGRRRSSEEWGVKAVNMDTSNLTYSPVPGTEEDISSNAIGVSLPHRIQHTRLRQNDDGDVAEQRQSVKSKTMPTLPLSDVDIPIYKRFEANLPRIRFAGRLRRSLALPPKPGTPTANPVSSDISDQLQLPDNPIHEPESSRRSEFLRVLDTTDSATEAWNAYQSLLELPHDGSQQPVPHHHLHRLSRALAAVDPPTHASFIRLLSVISTIHNNGGKVFLWQWNALINFSGKGWRKIKPEDFKKALGVYNDLISNKAPGFSFSRNSQTDQTLDDEDPTDQDRPSPDIFTYTTLVDIAGLTLHEPTFRHAMNLLYASGMKPNRITLLSMLRYYTRTGSIDGIRSTIAQFQIAGFDWGLDGINSCIWAFAKNNRIRVATAIFTVLKQRSHDSSIQDSSSSAADKIIAEEGILVPCGITPDQTTYTILIQSYAYTGDLIRSLHTFAEMVSALHLVGDAPVDPRLVSPAYRAIFLGFLRHSRSPRLDTGGSLAYRLEHLHDRHVDRDLWSFDALQALFDDFMGIPNIQASERTLYWILVAFARLSGEDTVKVKEIFTRIEDKFGLVTSGRLKRLKDRLEK